MIPEQSHRKCFIATADKFGYPPSDRRAKICKKMDGSMKTEVSRGLLSKLSIAKPASLPLGLSLRQSRPGPENDLVDGFIRLLNDIDFGGLRITVFREPKIETGFPDIVIAIWDETVIKNWNPIRRDIDLADIKLLHLIFNMGRSTYSELHNYRSNMLRKSLDNLVRSDLVVREGEEYFVDVGRNYAIRNIISIEAKISNVNKGISQAHMNTWFASESYLLLPKILERHSSNIAQFSGDIKLTTLDSVGFGRDDAQYCSLPRSYASWIFNEWCWHDHLNRRE